MSTYLGFREYWGVRELCDGHDESFSGSRESLLQYLNDLLSDISDGESLKWEGRIGTFYSGEAARQRIMEEIAKFQN